MAKSRTSSWQARVRILIAALVSICASRSFAATTTYTGVWAGGTIAPSNTVVLNDGASVTGNVRVDGTMQFNQARELTISSTLSGIGTLTISNTGTLALTATNSRGETSLPNRASLSSGLLNIGSAGTGRLLVGSDLSISGSVGLMQSTEANVHFSGISIGGPPAITLGITGGTWRNTGNLTLGIPAGGGGFFGEPVTPAYRANLSVSDRGILLIGGTLRLAAGSLAIEPGGTLQIGLGGTGGVLDAQLVNNGTLAFNRSDSHSQSCSISGSGGVFQLGSGTLTLTGANTYTGTTWVMAGTLVPSGTSTAAYRVANGTLRLANANSLYGGNTSLWTAGRLTVDSDATLSVSTATFSSTDSRLALLSSLGTGSSGLRDGARFGLHVSSGSFTYSSPLANANAGINRLAFVKSGTGTLILGGSSTYTGGTYIDEGTLQIGVTGSISGNIRNNGTLEFNKGGVLRWLGGITGTGALVVRTGTVVLSDTNTYTGTTDVYRVLHCATRASLYGGDSTKWIFGSIKVRPDATLRLSVGGPGEFTSADISAMNALMTGSAGFFVDSRLSLDTANAPSGTFAYAGSIAPYVGIEKSGSGTLLLLGSNSFFGGIQISSGSLQIGNGGTTGSLNGDIYGGAVTFSRSDASVYSGNARLYTDYRTAAFTKLGAGKLTLGGSIESRGDFRVVEGTVELASTASLVIPTQEGAKYIYVGGGVDASGTLTVNGGLFSSGLNYIGSEYGGHGTVNMVSGTMIADGVRPGRTNATWFIYNGDMNIFSGDIQGTFYVYTSVGGRGKLNIGGGTVLGSASIDGEATFSGGTWTSTSLRVGSYGSGVFLMSGGSLNGSAALGVTEAGAGFYTLTGGTAVFASMTVGSRGVGEIKVSGGSLTSTSATLGADYSGAGTCTITGGTWLNTADLRVGDFGMGSLSVSGNSDHRGILIVGGNLSVGVAGSVRIHSGGVLQIGTGSTTGDLSISSLSNNGSLVFDRSSAAVYSGILSGSGAVSKRGIGTLTLSGSNTLTGSTAVHQGTLMLAHASALCFSTISPLAGGTLSLTPSLQTTVGGLKPNAGGLIDLGTGEITVSSGLSVADLAVALQAGRGNGQWNGLSGIKSSAVAASNGSRSVGWIDNGNGSVTFGYAAVGDTNLDWTIDIIDIANLLGSGKINTGLTATWGEGDFNYDSFTDILDIADFMSTGLFNAGAYNAPAKTIAAVPEPTGMGVVGVALGLVGLGALRRKRVA